MSTQPKAEQIEFTPSGGITSTNLQAALAELDSDKINTANLAASSGSSLVGYDGGTVQDVLDGAVSKTDYAALRAYTGRAKRVYITGLLAMKRPAGIAGTFQYDPTDTTSADNGATIIVGADGRRWKRDFSGSVKIQWFDVSGVSDDTAKAQKAFDLAIQSKTNLFCVGASIRIDGTIAINKVSENRDPFYVIGGEFVKNNAGNMFVATNTATSDVYFIRSSFVGTVGVSTNVFECGDAKLIRTRTVKCQFKKLNTVFLTASYLQSIYIDACVFTEIGEACLKFGGLFDVKINKPIAELMTTGSLLKHVPSGQYQTISVLVVRDGALENFAGAPVMLLGSGGGIVIEGNYLEANPMGNIVFSPGAQLDVCRISSNSYIDDSGANGLIKWPKYLNGCTSENNLVAAGAVNNTTETTSGFLVSDNNYSGNGAADIDPNSRIFRRNKNSIGPRVISEDKRDVVIPLQSTTSSTSMVNLCDITLADNSGGGAYITIRGGGLQGNVGNFGINKVFKVIRIFGTTNYTITTVTDESWGDTTTQHTYVEMISSGGKLKINARSSTGLASCRYDLQVQVSGFVESVTFPA